jgi:parallel beta-helix repeat protein
MSNSYNLRIDRGEDASEASGSSNQESFIQEIDSSNLANGMPVCYLVKKSNVEVTQSCGFIGLIGCQNITISNQTIYNSSAGFLIVNSTQIRIMNCDLSQSEAGVYLLNSQIWSVKGCRAERCQTGFLSTQSKNGLFEDDAAINCGEEGFKIDDALNITLQRSMAKSGGVGISILNSRLCNFVNSSSKENSEAGIELIRSHKCLLRGNNVSRNERGIALTGSNACVISINNASTNKQEGFAMMQLSGADLLGNTAHDNGQGAFVQFSQKIMIMGNNLNFNVRYGLRMSDSSGCNITENSFVGNQFSGVDLVSSIGNFLYHNIFIDNWYQNALDNGGNQWDAGSKVGGNYWSDHKVNGNPGDIPRQIPTKGVDRYPFESPKGWM